MSAQQLGEVSRVGGWRGSPNSIAALRRYQVRWPYQRNQGKYRRGQKIAGDGHGRAESRYLRRLERRGLLPFELLALPCWRRLTEYPTYQRAPMRLALLQAWDKRDQSPLLWTSTQTRALGLVAAPSKSPPRRAWYLADA